ncbi:hypothetical protein HAALTHF_44520n [Vreelandella aquamarina]|nr:hypothetical protein HAALTHF_44520n [Halomonas axialensis]
MALLADLPNLDPELFQAPSLESLGLPPSSRPAPKVLLLYGSLRERSFSRLAVEEAARLLNAMGAETHIFNPRGLPLPDAEDASHPKVEELRSPSTVGRWDGVVLARASRGDDRHYESTN